MVTNKNSSPSTYEDSSIVAKVIVGGLTSIINGIIGTTPADLIERQYKYKKLTPKQLKELIQKDFDDGYLFSGEINPEIYCEDCSFTDPTISFQGLKTFEANIQNLKPFLDRFLGDRDVTLFHLELNESESYIKAQWRMSGDVLFPWKPRIILTGQTTFSYDVKAAGRVRIYYEVWDQPAIQVLAQLLYPAEKDLTEA